MKRDPSEMHGMHRMHLPHMHPIHWLGKHPLVAALLIAGLIALLFLGLTATMNPGIRMDTLDRFDFPAMYPYGGAY